MAANLFVHAAAGVGDSYLDIFTGRHGRKDYALLRYFRSRGGDGQISPAGHGVAGIYREIHEHLMETAGIDANASRHRVWNGFEDDIVADQSADHGFGFRQYAIQ